MSGKYDDIINLPHHVSATRPRMPLTDRAAQFALFAALRGYEATVRETARRTEERRELTEETRQELDAALRRISAREAEGAPHLVRAERAGGRRRVCHPGRRGRAAAGFGGRHRD